LRARPGFYQWEGGSADKRIFGRKLSRGRCELLPAYIIIMPLGRQCRGCGGAGAAWRKIEYSGVGDLILFRLSHRDFFVEREARILYMHSG
jgi:hypothetical protein